MATDTDNDLRKQLTDLVDDAPETAWSLSEALGRDGKWIGRKLKGKRKVYLSDVYALKYYLKREYW